MPQSAPGALGEAVTAECSSCGRRPASYFRRHSGERLCAVCLRRDLVRKIKRSFSLLGKRGFGLRVAVLIDPSRLAESLALTRLLDEIEREFGGVVVCVVAGEEALECLRDVRRHCWDTIFASPCRRVLEEVVRYGRASCDVGARVDVVALPGTLDDLLALFLRGLVLEGELVKPSVHAKCCEREFLIPLYAVPRADVVAYALASGTLRNLECPGSPEKPDALSRLASRLSLEHPELLYRFMRSMLAL